MIKKIGCIEIPLSDMEKAMSFYENVELRKAYQHPVWTSFDAAERHLLLQQAERH